MSSSTPRSPDHRSNDEDRRSHVRRKIDQLTYASFGSGNGGILLNLGEEGASFQGIGSVRTGQLVELTFKLPGTESQVEVRAEVVWSNDSGKGGGLRFIGLSDATRLQIREWLAGERSSENFAKELRPDTEPGSTLIASYENLMRSSSPPISSPAPIAFPTPVSSTAPASAPTHISSPALISSPPPAPPPEVATTEYQETVPASLDPSAGYIRPNFQLAPEDPSVPDNRDNRDSMPSFVLAEYPEPQPQKSTSPKYVLFATGVLAGCFGVLAAIVGMRMLANPTRTAIPESSQSSAALPVADEASRNSPANDAATNDAQTTSSNQSVDQNAAASERSMNKTAPEDVAAIEPSAPPEVDAKPLRDSPQKRNPNDRRNLAMLGPRMPGPRSKIESREPSVGEGAQPAFGSAEGSRIAVPTMPDVPRPPQPAAEKSGRAVAFTEPVLIDHNPPVYPASAMKKHIGGLVTVNATIGTDGVPRGLRLVSGDPGLGQAAEEAISHWRYVPAVSGGVPVESQVAITVNFQVKP